MRRSQLAIRWPVEYPQSGTHFWADQILSGMQSLGVRIERCDITQRAGLVMLLEIGDGDETHLVAFDRDDRSEIPDDVVRDVLVYFKCQYANDGYPYPNIVPGGYFLANNSAYRYLPLLRAVRSVQSFRYDVYGRFGTRYGGVELRHRACELLSARDDLRSEVSLFRYPGGPEKVPYRRFLFEIPRAKVCIDMPGLGDLCTRLIDYLAVGSCVVGPPPSVRLPIRLVDGEHLVYCASDLSDLGDVCAELVRDDSERERIATNARDFFDRHLHRRELASYYLATIGDAVGPAHSPSVTSRSWRRRRATRRVRWALGALAAAVILFVALPEALGDWPYDPIDRDTRAVHHSTLGGPEGT